MERPGKPILAFLDDRLDVQESLTLGELDRRARSIAAHLQELGLTGKAVAIAYPSGLEFACAIVAGLYAGAIVVPTCLPRSHGVDERMSMILSDSGARFVLTSARNQELIARHLAPGGSPADVIATDTLADKSDRWLPCEWTAEQLAVLQYTSGSTQSPRGVMISHGNLAANLDALHDVVRTDRDSVSISWLPLFHDMGLVAGLLEPLWVAYTAYLMAPSTFLQSPLRWLQAVSRYRGTISGGPNFAYEACVEAADSADARDLDLSTWRVAGNGAEPIRAKTLEQFRSTFAGVGFRAESLMPSYGLAEATLMVTANDGSVPAPELVVDDLDLRNGRVRECDADVASAKRLVSSGRAGRQTLVCIVDPDTLRESAAGRVGEIWVKNASVGQGYWRKPDETLATFGGRLDNGEGPFLRTGDLGFLNDGELFVTGRLKDLIVIRGVNFYPHDIEQTVQSSHPALRQDAGAVVGLDEEGRVRLVAVHEVRRDHWRTINPDEVFDAIRRAVAREHQVTLDGIVLLKPFSLPKTTSGKVQRSECRSALLEQSLPILHQWWAPAAQVAPIDFTGEPLTQPGVLERQLVDWLQKELSLTELGWHTPLLELGIDSLKGVELANALSAAFNHSFSATLIIDYPTIEALAGLIRSEVLGVASGPVRLQAADEASLSEQIEALDEDELEAMLQQSIDDVLRSGGRA
jgi:acyl-CoA synthetase (AMP-forming)/AMP-acid ligase II/acyl carrier protein